MLKPLVSRWVVYSPERCKTLRQCRGNLKIKIRCKWTCREGTVVGTYAVFKMYLLNRFTNKFVHIEGETGRSYNLQNWQLLGNEGSRVNKINK